MPSSLSSLAGEPNRLGLPASTRAIVLLVDGLGSVALKGRAGHARTLAGALNAASVMESGFPSTTAAALGSLLTGTLPGEHGLVGYTALDTVNDRVVNQLSGWDDLIDPATWQLEPTVFERATERGIGAVAIGPERYRHSGFSAAVLRGATYIAGSSIAERLEIAAEWIATPGDASIAYVYVPELDMAAHAVGVDSPEWTEALETLDAAVTTLVRSLGPTDGLIVTADHGVLDVPQHSHVLFDTDAALVDGVAHVAGDPRCIQLHFDPLLNTEDRAALVSRWRESESSRAWVVTRDEAISSGWFGSVKPEVAPRIGDLIVAARKNIAYYDSRTATEHGRAMVGQHGSLSHTELMVPLLRFGAFAKN